ncbi:MAG: AAA family ATPase [Planctomycetota bacterium JB042]
MSDTAEKVERFRERFLALEGRTGEVFVGQPELVRGVLTAIFAGGNALLEGLPGLGKTHLVKTLSRLLGLTFSRIQFTPDLMPADVTGTNVIVEDEAGRRSYVFRRGPIFAHLVLADEVNRATPKTQAAMLEAMQERSVTAWGERHEIEEPFFVLATQNPIEMEGTYPLPEAQLDRFLFKLSVRGVTREELVEIVRRTTGGETAELEPVMARDELLEWQRFVRSVVAAPHVLDFVARLVLSTHPDDPGASPRVKKLVRFGASPRASQALVLGAKVRALLDGRMNVSFGDVRAVALPALRHRILTTYEAEVDGVTADDLVRERLESLPETVET